VNWRPAVRIDRCVCQRLLFAQLLPVARANGWTLDAIMDETGCGDQCGMCRPYLRAMLADGTTVFHEILEDVTDAAAVPGDGAA
jgi:bacterioferritin-associated ferredoxin